MQALLDTIARMELPLDACRLFHGRGGCHPGCEQWTLDFFAPVWLLTSFAPASEAELAQVDAALRARWQQLAPGSP
jgi:23S rRNA (cytosine1962-C5)-methyltransferase